MMADCETTRQGDRAKRLIKTFLLVAWSLGLSVAVLPKAAHAALGPIKHVVVVVDENTNFLDAFNSSNMPFMTNLINTKGALATSYYANTHPSIGNYFELITGQILTNNDSQTPSSFPISQDNIVRELLAAGLTWKAYCESIPSVGYIGGNTGQYAVRHCALPYLTDVQNDATQRQNLVPFTQFGTDLASGQLPNFSFIAPNLCNDAHDCTIPGSLIPDDWLKNNLTSLLNSPTFNQDTIMIFLWDESNSDNTHGGGRVEWAAFGATVKQGYQQTSTTVYQHQSTLRFILKELGVTVFPGSAASAPDMGEFFNLTSGSACDINNDGVTNVADLQLEVNQALGMTTCTADINKDGVCNVIDVQRVANAALGGACVSP